MTDEEEINHAKNKGASEDEKILLLKKAKMETVV